MSILPNITDDFYQTGYHHFGSAFYPDDFWSPPIERALMHSVANTGNHLRSQLSVLGDFEQKAHIGKDGFQVCMDVHHFQPKEISVKTENNSVVVTGKHEEKRDNHGYISREFTRRYELPSEFKADNVTSSLSSDRILSIKCPKTEATEGSNVRHIHIHQTGPAKLNIKGPENKK